MMQSWRGPQEEAVDFLVSYADEDQAWAEWIASELEVAGAVVRLRAWDAVAGSVFVLWMNQQVAVAGRTVALYSPDYFDSVWCTLECTAALSKQVLLPVKIRECEIPGLLANVGHVPLLGTDETVARERVLRAAGLRESERRSGVAFPGPSEPPATSRDEDSRAAVSIFKELPETWNVGPRHMWFVGRETLLSRIDDGFRPDGSSLVVSQVLAGPGGSGKTRLAVEYAYRFADRYSLVWWISAAERSGLIESLEDLADALGLPADEDREGRARRAVRSLRRLPNWLVVFDNVDDRNLLSEWWPTGNNGNILVTTRNRALGEFGDMHSIGLFRVDEASSLLRRRADHLTDGDARRIAEALDLLPLAVSQAAAYIATTGISGPRYLELLSTALSSALAGAPADYPLGLVGSVATAAVRLAEKDPSVLYVLRVAAFLAPAPLPLNVLAELAVSVYPGASGLVASSRVLLAINTYGFAQTENDTFELHRLTQAVLRDQLTAGEQQNFTTRAQEVLVRATPSNPDDPGRWPEFAELASHIHAVLGHLSATGGGPAYRAVALAVVDYLTNSGQYTSATHLARDLLERWTAVDGPDHPDRMSAADRLGEGLRGLGAFEDAEAVDQATYEGRMRLFGPGHPDTLRSADRLGVDQRGLGNRARARDLHARALASARTVLGADHPQTLDIAHNLAVDLHGLGELTAARALDEETYTCRRKVLGPAHPQTLSSARNLARDLRALGQHEFAREIARGAFETSRQVLGPDHPDTLLAASSLAVLHYALGDLEAARVLHEDSLHRSVRALGADHPNTLRVANSLGVDLFRLGHAEAARRLHGDTLDRLRQTAGADHPETLHVAHNLARDLEGVERLDEAIELLRDTLGRRIRVLGPDHRETQRTHERLRRALARATGRPADVDTS